MPKVSIIEAVIWAVLIVLVVGYGAGNVLNRRRSQVIGRWLQAGLGLFGGKAAWRWTRGLTSGGEVALAECLRPFRKARISYFLLTRELPVLWGIERLRGRYDTLAIQADLRSHPQQEFEVLPIRGRLRSELDRAAGDQPWQWMEMPGGLGLATRRKPADKLVNDLKGFLERYGSQVQRFSLRDRAPNLVVFVQLADLAAAPSSAFFKALKRVVEGSVTSD